MRAPLPLLAFAVVLACSGCDRTIHVEDARAPQAVEGFDGIAGRRPSLESAQVAAERVMATLAHDSSSILYQWPTGLVLSEYTPGDALTRTWALTFQANCKNKMGAYVGLQPCSMHFRDDNLIAVRGPSDAQPYELAQAVRMDDLAALKLVPAAGH